MAENIKSPFDKEPAEGSRDIVERELERQDKKDKGKDEQSRAGRSGQNDSAADQRR